jgi:hypothetical protein
LDYRTALAPDRRVEIEVAVGAIVATLFAFVL